MSDQVRRPAFQFYPDDWLSDIALKRCSLAAKGLWADLLCYMHRGEPYGHLTTGGKAITIQELARMVGAPAATVRKLLAELDAAGVPSKTTDGIYFSRRMVRDERVRQARAAGGAESLKNPNVPRPKLSDSEQGRVEGPLKGSPSPPSFKGSPSSSSSSSSPSTTPYGVVPRVRTASLVQPRRKDAAFEYGRLYVPQRAHADLMMLRNHGRDEQTLFAWYEAVCEDYTNGGKANTPLPTDLIAFWKARYSERWPETLRTSVRTELSAVMAARVREREQVS